MSNADDILDLDSILPPVRKIRIGGKLIDCHPLTIQQHVELAKLETLLSQVKSEDEIYPLIKKTLSPFIPAFKNDDIEITIAQMKAIIDFAQKSSVPKQDDKKVDKDVDVDEYTPKKKQSLAKE